MFGGGRSKGAKAPPKRKPRSGGGLAQFGLMDIPDINLESGMADDDDDNDDDLEAELLALQQSDGIAPRAKPNPPQTASLDQMIKDSMRDIPSDEDEDVDENDPDLLAELSSLSAPPVQERAPSPQPAAQSKDVISTLNERIAMYKQAEASAKSAGEPAKARRCNRGMKTLQDLLRKAKAGRPINEDDIPPPVATTTTRADASGSGLGVSDSGLPPSRSEVNLNTVKSPEPETETPAPIRPASSESDLIKPTSELFVPTSRHPGDMASPSQPMEVQEPQKEMSPELQLLYSRRDDYKKAAVEAKRNGDVTTALQYAKVVKQFQTVISAAESGREVDLSKMPGQPAPARSSSISHQVAVSESQTPKETASPAKTPDSEPAKEGEVEAAVPDAPVPKTVMEALEQRMAKWQEQENKAKEEGNNSKARRLGRIVKQYKDAIRSHKAGKSVEFSELPAPYGFPPIPGFAQAPLEIPNVQEIKEESPEPPGAAASVPEQPSTSTATNEGETPTRKAPAPPPPEQKVKRAQSTRASKQQQQLEKLQREFKLAAINAKEANDIEKAKEYLRKAKGFDKLIATSKCGLPVDMSSLPVPPSKANVAEDFEIVEAEDCDPVGEDVDIFKKLQEDLIRQVHLCTSNRNHYRVMGDVAGANRFDQLAAHTKKDLDTVRSAYKHDRRLPKFHYEMRPISVVRCCTDLNDNDVELQILRGINYNVSNPKDVDTYIRYEFPIPPEEPQRGKTNLVKDTNNPEYKHVVKFDINRKARSMPRWFKRHAIKLEVWSKGGFLRSDTLLGTASVKLEPLETKCELHNSFELLEGRKRVGGQVEAKVRIRTPIISKEVETTKEKWLVIDQI